MQRNQLKIIMLFVFTIGVNGLKAQESINAIGKDISGNGGSISYSVGQVFYSEYDGASVSVIQGVQQPYEISTITSINEKININLSVFVYPNPVTNHLILTVDDMDISNLTLEVYNMNGSLLYHSKIAKSKTIVYADKYAPGSYLLKILNEETLMKTFKIIKK